MIASLGIRLVRVCGGVEKLLRPGNILETYINFFLLLESCSLMKIVSRSIRIRLNIPRKMLVAECISPYKFDCGSTYLKT